MKPEIAHFIPSPDFIVTFLDEALGGYGDHFGCFCWISDKGRLWQDTRYCADSQVTIEASLATIASRSESGPEKNSGGEAASLHCKGNNRPYL
jgi:hypothetical protein